MLPPLVCTTLQWNNEHIHLKGKELLEDERRPRSADSCGQLPDLKLHLWGGRKEGEESGTFLTRQEDFWSIVGSRGDNAACHSSSAAVIKSKLRRDQTSQEKVANFVS